MYWPTIAGSFSHWCGVFRLCYSACSNQILYNSLLLRAVRYFANGIECTSTCAAPIYLVIATPQASQLFFFYLPLQMTPTSLEMGQLCLLIELLLQLISESSSPLHSTLFSHIGWPGGLLVKPLTIGCESVWCWMGGGGGWECHMLEWYKWLVEKKSLCYN